MNLIAVFFGGGIGALCRWGLSLLIPISPDRFPWATFFANLLSCLVLGLFIGLVGHGRLDRSWQLLLMTGFCGGFSTFSTFSMETLNLIQSGESVTALMYILFSLILGTLCIYLGMLLTA